MNILGTEVRFFRNSTLSQIGAVKFPVGVTFVVEGRITKTFWKVIRHTQTGTWAAASSTWPLRN